VVGTTFPRSGRFFVSKEFAILSITHERRHEKMPAGGTLHIPYRHQRGK